MEDKFSTRNIIARTAAVKNLYQDLKIEMDQMVQFFNSYQNLIGQTLEIAVKITEKNKAS